VKLSTALLAGCVVLISAMGTKGYELSERARSEADELTNEVRELRQLQRGLLELVNAAVPETPTLAGIDVVGSSAFDHVQPAGTVIYAFGTHCPWSPANVEILNELHRRGLNVVGLVRTEPRRSVEVFARSHAAEFPILAEPSGPVLDLLPRGATPLTATLGIDGVNTIWLGPIDEGRRTVLEALIPGSP
jgi:hypothetical protein